MKSIEKFLKDRRLWLILVLILAGSLRLYGLTYESLWNDELSGIVRASFPSLKEVIKYSSKDTHPSLYIITLHLWMKTFGNSVASVRSLSMLFGIINIFLIFILGRMIYSYKEGLLSALVFGISFWHIGYSLEARNYTILFTFVILSYIFFWKIFSSKHSLINYLGYIISLLIMMFTHYVGIFIFLTQIITAFCLLRKNTSLKKIVISQLIALLLFSVQFKTILQLSSIKHWITKPTLDTVRKCFNCYWGNDHILIIIAIIAILIYFINTFTVNRKIKRNVDVSEKILLFWIFLTYVMIHIKSIVSLPVLVPRTAGVIYPAIVLLFSRGVFLIKKKKNIIIFLCLFVLISFRNIFVIKHFCVRPRKQQFREAAKICVTDREILDESIVFSYAHNKKYFEYYFDMFNCPRRVIKNLKIPKRRIVGSINSIVRRNKKQYFWLLTGHLRFPEEVLDELNKEYRCIKHEKLIGAQAILFAVK